MKYTGSKVKLSRRLGIPLSQKAAKCMERRPGAPGMHRSRFGKKLTEYGRQLLEKQKLRIQYNITERTLRNAYDKASRAKGSTADNLIQRLESRLDALVLRAGFAPSIYAARQLVNHGHVNVNGRRVSIPSCNVKPGSVLTLRQKSRGLDLVKNAMQNAQPVPYLDVDRDKISATYTRLPAPSEIPVVCEVSVVVEFYSK